MPSDQTRTSLGSPHRIRKLSRSEVTFVLDGLTLARLGAPRDGSGDEDDELAGGAALEVAEVAHVRRVREHHSIRARPAAGRGAPGAGTRRLQHQKGGNLHLLTHRSTALAISWLLRDG